MTNESEFAGHLRATSDELWVLFQPQGAKCTEMAVEQIDKITPKRFYYTRCGRQLFFPIGRVQGVFPSYELAADAAAAARYAYNRATESRESGLIWAKSAIKDSPGYSPALPARGAGA